MTLPELHASSAESNRTVSAIADIAPTYAELSNAPTDPGSIVYIDGSGTDSEGVYGRTSAGYTGPIGSGDANTQAFVLAGSGSADLGTSGDVVVDTGVPADTTSHFQPVVSPPDGVDVATSLEYDSATSLNYLLHVEQNTTSTGSVSVGWQLMESNL